jgi:hypothetical protein
MEGAARWRVVLIVTSIMLILSTLFTLLRLISRFGIVRRVSWDDYAMIVAWVRFLPLPVTRRVFGPKIANQPMFIVCGLWDVLCHLLRHTSRPWNARSQHTGRMAGAIKEVRVCLLGVICKCCITAMELPVDR